MTSSLPKITGIFINYMDRDFKSGLRSVINCLEVELKGLTEDVKEKLVMEYNSETKLFEIETPWDFMGPHKGMGMLMFREPDHYNGPDLKLAAYDDRQGEMTEAAKEGKGTSKNVHFSVHGMESDHTGVSEFTEYIVIKTFFEDKKEPLVEICPLNRRLAKHEDPKYASSIVELKGSQIWGCVVMSYPHHDKNQRNNVVNNAFEYLILKENVKVDLSDDLFWNPPAAGMMGGGEQEVDEKEMKKHLDSIKATNDQIKEAIAKNIHAEKEIRKLSSLKEYDADTTEKLKLNAIKNIMSKYITKS